MTSAKSSFIRQLVLLAQFSLLAGCAVQSQQVEATVSDLVWPPAPETPRIRFLYELTDPGDAGIRLGWMRRLVGAIGGRDERRVYKPYGLSTDAEGRLYVIDNRYQAVHVFDPANNKYHRFPDEPRDGFVNPVGIALGTEGRIYVSDSVAGVVHVFTNLGRRYQGSIGSGQLQRPTGIVSNHRTAELLVLDTVASMIFVYDEGSQALKRVMGAPDDPSENGIIFHAPTNIAVSDGGRVYVSDSLNFRVQVLDAGLQLIRAFGAPGNVPGSFSRPKGLATDSDGHIYVVDALFDNVQIFDQDGSLMLAFGGPGNVHGKFWLPNAIHIDSHDRIYVSDSYNKRVQVFQYLKPAETVN